MDSKVVSTIIENLWNEIVYGVIIIGALGFSWKYIRDFFKARRLFRRVLGVHNDPTRTRPKGFCFIDRFMEIYESKEPMRSITEKVQPYAIWANTVVDEKVLEYHGLVTVTDRPSGRVVSPVRNRVTSFLYKRCHRLMEKDRKRWESFIHDETRRKI